jgi:probable F420-dependent oxidoreductase
MRFGAILPVPGQASPAQVLDFAVAAEDSGFDAVYMNSRVARPVRIESRHPYTPDGSPPWPPDVNWPDTFVLFSFIAARTTRLRFGPAVAPVIVTHPLTLAKQAATLDVYSGGRLELGLGAGWMLEEAEAVARPVDRRWRRLEETIEILRLAWSSATFSYEGSCYRVSEVGQHPHPVQGARLPIWIGGHGQRALEIAARSGAGLFLWGGYLPEKAAGYVRRVREMNPATKVATLVHLTAQPDGVDRTISELESAGIDLMVVSARLASYDERLEAIRNFGARFAIANRG